MILDLLQLEVSSIMRLSASLRQRGSLEKICCIGDGDTGYGNAVNVKRTVRGYAQAGMAGVMIEDQVAMLCTKSQLYNYYN